MEIPITSQNISRPYINTTNNKVEYLTDEQAAKRDDIRQIKPGEKITPDQMSDVSSPSGT
jgi:hypothetical protein